MSSTGAPLSIGSDEYWACPSVSLATSFEVTLWRNSSAPGPSTVTSPMWETSKSPAAVRTAMCSLMRPAYSTGMSQPPKGTILAPLSRCAEFSGVFCSTRESRYHIRSWLPDPVLDRLQHALDDLVEADRRGVHVDGVRHTGKRRIGPSRVCVVALADLALD